MCKLGVVLVGSFVAAGLGAVALYIAVAAAPFDPAEYSSRQISTSLFDRTGKPLRAYLGSDERWRAPVLLSEVSPSVIQATLAVEDKRFYRHRGIDWAAVLRACWLNMMGRRIVSGASTITMQVANFSDSGSRTLSRKLRQAFTALQLERHFSKTEILELYLTQAPYGGNICGVEAAARRYFNKGAGELCLAEAALLAGLPQSPTRFRPDKHLARALVRRKQVLERLNACGYITAEERVRVQAQIPAVGEFNTLSEAPHYCNLVGTRYRGPARVNTTLDLEVQRRCEQMLEDRLATLKPKGITNGAVVVIENPSGEVIAMVGSADFNNARIQGQVNGATALRSPGSALKPLIYAYAYRSGSLLPGSMLYDVPQSFPQYQPTNFDDRFRGLVCADEALAKSLNLPAIQVLKETGPSRTLHFLRSCGMSSLRESTGNYGLSLAIGTCNVCLLDLTNAYAMLARGGIYKPYRLVRSSSATMQAGAASVPVSDTTGTRLLTPAAAYFVTRALSDSELRPPVEVDPVLNGLDSVAWKTGTSNGNRDAWTIAYDPFYTVGVWLGNFDGRPSPALVGASAAAPLALRLVKDLRPSGADVSNWPPTPKAGIRTIEVCSESGYPSTSVCPASRAAAAPTRAGPHWAGDGILEAPPFCTVHRSVAVDVATSTVVCARCLPGREVVQQVYAFWPDTTAAWLAKNAHTSNLPPPHCGACPSVRPQQALQIVSPQQDDAFIVAAERSASAQKLALEAVVPPGAQKLFWFLNGTLVEETRSNTVAYLAPSAGTHRLVCVDEAGHSDELTFTVTRD